MGAWVRRSPSKLLALDQPPPTHVLVLKSDQDLCALSGRQLNERHILMQYY
jgi:hypothetical protein